MHKWVLILDSLLSTVSMFLLFIGENESVLVNWTETEFRMYEAYGGMNVEKIGRYWILWEGKTLTCFLRTVYISISVVCVHLKVCFSFLAHWRLLKIVNGRERNFDPWTRYAQAVCSVQRLLPLWGSQELLLSVLLKGEGKPHNHSASLLAQSFCECLF